MQMVVVPAMSTNATTDIAKVSFTVLPLGRFGTETGESGGLKNFGKDTLTLI
jgi:hypothetical protein